MKREEQKEREKDLKAINGKKTAEDAFFEAGSKHNHVVLFIHGWIGNSSLGYRSNDRDVSGLKELEKARV